MGDLSRAESIVETALKAAEGDQADAFCVVADRSLTRFASSTIHQNMAERSTSLTVRVVSDRRIGVASSSPTSEDEILATVALAADLARRSEPLPDFDGLHREAARAAANAFDEATAGESAREKAEALRAIFDDGKRSGLAFAGSLATTGGALAAGNSHGVRQSAPWTSAEASFIALGSGASGFATSLSRRRSAIDLPALAAEAARKASMLRGTEGGIEPGTYTVILEPPALAEIFEWMNSITFGGRSFEDGSSFFVGNVGTEMLGTNFSLADDATDPDFLLFPFDLEGMPKRRVPIVEEGVIRGPLVDKVAADRLRIQPTGSAAGLGSGDQGVGLHLSMEGGEDSIEDLIAATQRGIWITRFHYLNGLLDPKSALMTGMTRDGTFLIEDGRVTRRLPNLRWTQSMVEAFRSIEGLTREKGTVGAFWNTLGGTRAPAAKIANWQITGQTGA